MDLHAQCSAPGHRNNKAHILCTDNCINKQIWICDACVDHNKTTIGNKMLTHPQNEDEFKELKAQLIQVISNRPQQLQFILRGYHKMQEILYRIVNYIQQNQKNMQEYVDDILRKMKEDLKFISQLNFYTVNAQQAEQINKIRSSRSIDPSEYYKSTLRRDLYKLIDLYKDAQRQTETQVRDYFQEQPQNIQSQSQNTNRIVNTTCISTSGTCGISLGRLDVFEVLSQNCIAKLQFQDVITAVSFSLKPSDQQFIYELAVCTKKYIQFCVFNLKDKKIELTNQQQYNYKKFGEIIKFIYLNQFEYIVIGDKLSYFSQPDKIIDTITVTDIDVSSVDNRILIGNKQGFVKFQEFEQNGVVVFLNSTQMTQAHDGQAVVSVKIRQAEKNQSQGKRYLTAGLDDLIKIWNFQGEIKCQLKINCNTASFVGTSNLLAIFNKKQFEIGVFYEIDENDDTDEKKVSYERIKCKQLNFDQEYLKNTKILQNIGIVIKDDCFIQTITRDNLVQRYLDDAALCLKLNFIIGYYIKQMEQIAFDIARLLKASLIFSFKNKNYNI
ncbi:hypothetical protein pb186bvf_015430 [Paramecium bursaria]